MGIEVTFNAGLIERKLLDCVDDDVRVFAHNTFYKLMEPYVPADTLTMYNTAAITAEDITFKQPYSYYPWYGKSRSGKPLNYTTDKHPLACDHWADAAWQARGDTVLRDIEAYISHRRHDG